MCIKKHLRFMGFYSEQEGCQKIFFLEFKYKLLKLNKLILETLFRTDCITPCINNIFGL